MIILSLLFACSSGKDTVDPTATQVIEENEVVQGDLNGNFPAENIPAPDFSAINYDGSQRNKDALIGHPTVIWFFPRAQTYG